jgi:hypothetical protein
MKQYVSQFIAALAAVVLTPATAQADTVGEVNFQEAAAAQGFTDIAAGRDNLAIGYEVCAMQDEGYGYQTLTGYVIDEFPNIVPMPDTYQAAVGVIIPASTYLCPRHQAAWENY